MAPGRDTSKTCGAAQRNKIRNKNNPILNNLRGEGVYINKQQWLGGGQGDRGPAEWGIASWIYKYIYMYIYHICICICIHVYIYICIYIYIYICMCMYIWRFLFRSFVMKYTRSPPWGPYPRVVPCDLRTSCRLYKVQEYLLTVIYTYIYIYIYIYIHI